MYGDGSFEDTYFGIIIREDVETEALAALSDLPMPMKVDADCTLLPFDEMFDGTKTYADFKQWEIDRGEFKRFEVTVVVTMDGTDKSEKEEYANQIFDRIEEDGFHGGVSVCFFPSETFEKLTRTNYNELVDLNHVEYARYWQIIN